MSEDGFASTLVPIDKIKPPIFQCRSTSLDENLDELVESIKTVGLLQPLTIRIDHETQPELVLGSRRLKACQKAGLRMVPVIIRDLTDEQALEIEGSENLNRNDLSAEEKTRLVSEWARRGYDANKIALKVHKSYNWVTSFLPTEFKDKVKVEAGKLGGEARAATIIVAENMKHTVKTQDMQICEYHNTASSDTDFVTILGKPRRLCGRCRLDYPNNTLRYESHFRHLNGKSKTLEERLAEKPGPAFKEKWEQTLGTMRTNDPEAERFHDEEAQALGLYGFRTHVKIAIIEVEVDRMHMETNTLFWYDNEELHKGERADKDEYYRKILEKRGFKNEVHSYKGKTTRAKVRAFLVAWQKKTGA